ncbi:MAG: glycoside hydrolase [Acidobacteriia bacterium]|nr:glycoside hydrolase [Terriglobia bacterium]
MFSSLSVLRGKSWLVCAVLLTLLTCVALAADSGFSPQARVGFTVGDQWEPAIAADGYGHVYVLYPQYGTVPDCRACPLPTLVLVSSDDNGVTWQEPRQIGPPASGQFDAQIVVDPVDHRTVYAAWIQNHETDTVVAKSVDFGQSWSQVIAARNADTDKPVLAVHGADVYVAFNHARQMWVAASHDGGITFSSGAASTAKLNWSLPGGGTVDPAGNVYFAWAGYTRTQGKRTVNLYTSKSADGGKTWSTHLMDVSGAPPDCSAQHCGWSYLGAQITMASDAAGTLYALWNAGREDKSPERIYFASSTTGGATWSQKLDVSSAAAGVEHAFPAITAGSAGDVRIAWMDSRVNPLWNTYYRSSTNGGATWSQESRLSSYVPAYTYIQGDGFVFPFGDYFGIAIDSQGRTHAAWGEGLNFKSPGSIWHSSGR